MTLLHSHFDVLALDLALDRDPPPEPPAIPLHVDEDGLLRLDDRWVALTDLQVPVARRLLADLGSMVSGDDLLQVYRSAGGSTHVAALRSLMARVGARFTEVGAAVSIAPACQGMCVIDPRGRVRVGAP